MRKVFAVLLVILAVICCGCGKTEEPRLLPEKGDFSFALPEGYSLDDITDTDCSILDPDGTAVGGIRLADILPGELLDSDSAAMPRYLDSTAEGCEYFSWKGSDPEHPAQYVTQQFTDPQTQEKRVFSRLLFVKEDIVYDMWFDTALIGDEEISRLHFIAEEQ